MNDVDPAKLEHLAILAGLDPEVAEREGLTGRLAAVGEWLAVLDGQSHPSVAADSAFGLAPPRNDAPEPGLQRETAYCAAPEVEDGFFSVPPLRGVDDRRRSPDPIPAPRVADDLNCWRALADPGAASPAPDAATDAGPLAGLGAAIKANICCPGLPADCCSRILGGWLPPYAATVVERLRAAGVRILGTTNMDEFAMGSSTENSAFGPTINPRAPGRVPGGSSGGAAAAVAAGLADFALGSDTGGSVRQPAHCCGVVGLKPTYGRVSRFGLVAFASSFDQIGPLAPTVTRCAEVYAAIAGHDPRDATSLVEKVGDPVAACSGSARAMRVGAPRGLLESGVEPGVAAAFARSLDALRAAGARIVDIEQPAVDSALAAYYVLASAEASANLARYDGSLYGARRTVPGGGWDDSVRATRSAGFGTEVQLRILLGTYVLSAGYGKNRYRQAQQARAAVAAGLGDVLAGCDAIATPTSPHVAFPFGDRIDDPVRMYLADSFTVPANLAGLPAISVPAGDDPAGLPVGCQLTGRALGEEAILTLAAALERELAGREGA